MSVCLAMCLGVLFSSGWGDAEEARPLLIKISRSHPDVVSLLQERNIPVNFKLAEWYIAEARSADIESIESEGIEYEILDREAWTHPYSLISRPQQRPLGEIPGAGQIVYRGETEAIVKMSGDGLLDLARAGFQLTKLSQRPLPLTERAAARAVSLGDAVKSEEVVDAIVNQVSAVTTRSYVQHLQDYETRLWASEPIWPASQWIYDLFLDFGYTDVVFEEFVVSGDDYVWYQPGYDVTVRNVIATKRGTVYPDSVYIIGGHYDSIVIDGGVTDPYVWAPGADDNASGTVAALEAARILANIDLDCTVKFACWTAEEIGLYGADYYAEKAHQRGENIALYMNFDMIANVDVNDPVRDVTIYRDAPSRPYADLMEEMALRYTTLVPVQRAAGGGSDHVPFMQYGYNIVYGEEADFSPNWHQPTDITDNMDFTYLADVIKAALGTLVTLAGPPESLSDPVILFESCDMDDSGQGGSTGNGNGYYDPGETIQILPSLHNYGTMQASNVSGQLKTDDSYVTILTSTQNFGDIPGGETRSSQGLFRFALAQDVPNGRTILFSLEGTASGGRQWITYFSVKVEAPEMVYRTYIFVETVGDGNGILDPGETVSVLLDIENTGLRPASGITGTVTTDDVDMTITDNSAVFTNAGIDGISRNTGDPFTFSLDGEAEPHAVVFTLHLSEGQGYYQTDLSFRVLIGQGTVLLVADDEEVDNQHYYTDALSYLGIPYDVQDEQAGARSRGDLSQYAEVIWFTGYAQTNTLEPADRDALQTYLDNGGRLLISGSMLGYDIGNTWFYQHYLHGKFVSFMTLLYHLQEAPGNPVVGDMYIALAEDGPNGQGFAGETNPVSPAVSIFNYDRTAPEGPGIIKSSGSGALAVETAAYKVIYCSFGLEGVESTEDRAQILIDALTWFKTPGVDKGDVDGNGSTNIIDAIVAVNFVLGTDEPSAGEMARADMNYDDIINVLDVIGVVNAVLGSGR